MGFDNECILNIQSLPGEYFCPVCRTLIYPNEALQTQCTHLYCKPCLAYVVATTKACPYDGYLVTETDSKLLVESNKPLAETIGRVTVHCLYNKSGCQWQGTLSACITHGNTCAYGNSPVVCNRCGTQIVHRQVQEHAQLCPGVQSQTQQADGSQAQPSTATVTKDPSLVSSAGSAAAAATIVPSATTATSVTASSAATGGSAAATTVAAPPSFAGSSASAPQTATAEQWYQQQMQYSQYYQQQYPGYNPYTQQYQQYGQYQQAYQQYTQPQMQVASQNVVQASVQSSQVSQSSQPQQMMHQPQLQAPTGHPQTQQHQVQPQSHINLPHLEAPAGQMQPQQPMQSTYQVPPMQQQSQVPLQLPAPQAHPTVHQPASTQVGNQQFVVPSAQATPHQVQPPVQTQPSQLQTLPQQQHPQPQMQLNSQIQQQSPQVQLQSYPQSQAYPQPTPLMHSQNTSHPQQQMPPGAPQHPVHASHQQGLVSQHPAPMRPPIPSQQPAMLLPQEIQHIPHHQQYAGYHDQRPPMHSSIPSQAPQHGLPPHSSVSSQAGQSYQQGMPSSQQQVHSQPSQPHGLPYTQQHIPGYGYAGQHGQSSAGRSMNPAAPPQQFQPQSSGPVNYLQANVVNQQSSMLGTSDTRGKPTGWGSLTSETQALKSGKSENASGAAHNSAISENRTNGAESSVMKPTMSQLLGDENMNGEQNDFGSSSKDGHTVIAVDNVDNSIGKEGIAAQAGNCQAPSVQGGKEHKASDTYNNLEKGGPVQQASQRNAEPAGAFVPLGMGPQHPSEPDRMFPQHKMNSGPMPYNMQGQPNQTRPPKHSFAGNNRPPLEQPYGSLHSGMAQRTFVENLKQFPGNPQPAGIRPGDGMVQPPIVGLFPGHHDTMPPFLHEPLGWQHPPGMSKSNGVGSGPFVSGRAFHKEGFNASGEHLRSFAAYPDRHNIHHKDVEDLKQFPGPAHLDVQALQMGPNSFERTLGRPDGFPERPFFANQKGQFPVALREEFTRKPNATGHPDFLSPSAEFDHHGSDGMPNLRNSGPFFQGMSAGPGGVCKDYLGSVNLPGTAQHAFDGPMFPHTRFHPDHMHPDDPNLAADYSLHGFPKEPGHFGLGGLMRNAGTGWCRICLFNCGSAENLDLHVQTKEHQHCAMDLVLKMKQDVAKRQKLNLGGPKSFNNKKVAGKVHFRGNRR